ncbi:MAG: polysaccharide biosynthesis C-terminal domain-containing protein [Deltaproteobacteria bacterium]|nr:polysaccharide biosynthesis C-terminal domain-containing protein [Deltaproteobacteria bacterium]
MTSINLVIFKDTFFVTWMGWLATFLGFWLPVYMAGLFGAGNLTDAFFLALVMINMVAGIVINPINSVVVPVFVDYRIKEPGEAGRIFGSSTLLLGLISLAAILVIVVLVYARPFPQLLGAQKEAVGLVMNMTMKLLPMVPAAIFATFLAATYGSFQKFGLSESIRGVHYVLVLVAMFLGHRAWGINSAVIGHVVGALAEVALAAWLVRTLDFTPVYAWRIHPALKDMLRLSKYPMIGSCLLQLNPFLDRLMSLFTGQGNASVLGYAEKVALIPLLLLGTGFSSVILSHWSKYQTLDQFDEVKHNFQTVVSLTVFLFLPVVLLILVFRLEIVEIIFLRGRFTVADAELTAKVLAALILGSIPYMVVMVQVNVFLSQKNTLIPFLNGLLNVGLNITLNLALAFWLNMGVVGIGLSTSGTYLALCLFLGHFLRRQGLHRFSLRTLVEGLRLIVAGLATCLAAYYINIFARTWMTEFSLVPKTALLMTMLSVGLVVYFGVSWLIKKPEMIMITAFLSGKLRRTTAG